MEFVDSDGSKLQKQTGAGKVKSKSFMPAHLPKNHDLK